jgi:hypothetical protein
MLRMSTKMMCYNAKEKLEFSTKGLAASRMSYYFFFYTKSLLTTGQWLRNHFSKYISRQNNFKV